MNNIISRMTLRRRCSEEDGVAEEVGKLVTEMCELAGELNVADMIWFCKSLDLQGFGRRVRDVRKRYDVMMEKIIKEHEEERKRKKEDGEDDGVKDLLDILLDFYEDESSQIKLTRENIKAFVMVRLRFELQILYACILSFYLFFEKNTFLVSEL